MIKVCYNAIALGPTKILMCNSNIALYTLSVYNMRMRTNVVLNDQLVAEAMKLTGITTKRGIIEKALEYLVLAKKRRPLSEIRGVIKFAENYDHKSHRDKVSDVER